MDCAGFERCRHEHLFRAESGFRRRAMADDLDANRAAPDFVTLSDSVIVSPIWLGRENSQSSLTIGKPTRRCAIICA